MNQALRKISFFIGLGILVISMFWSQDGFNFDVAGQSGYKTGAVIIGWFLALSVTCIEFVFSSNFKELNASLILFGVLAYAYSIYTNYLGILHFQGANQNNFGAIVLGIVMDGVPEPLIAWSLYESLSGDFIGNIIKALAAGPDRYINQNGQHNQNSQNRAPDKHRNNDNRPHREMPEGIRERLAKKPSASFDNLYRLNSEFRGKHDKSS